MNPRAAINDLHPFQGCPFSHLGYFSKYSLPLTVLFLISNYTSYKGLGWRGISSGEGGIRTHAPLRTNGFQDRLVMTTSIPLRVRFALSVSVERKNYSSKDRLTCQPIFLFFYQLFFYSPFLPRSEGLPPAFFRLPPVRYPASQAALPPPSYPPA